MPFAATARTSTSSSRAISRSSRAVNTRRAARRCRRARVVVRPVALQRRARQAEARRQATGGRARGTHEGAGGSRVASSHRSGAPECDPRDRPSVEDAGRRYLDHLAGVGRKRSTLMDYESHLRVHLAPFFGAKPLHRIEPRDVEAFVAAKRRAGRAPKSILNYLGLLHAIFEFGQ